MTTTRLISLALLTLCLAQVGYAQPRDQATPPIVLRGLIMPETERISVTTTCFSQEFRFTILNHRNRPSELVEATLNGRAPRDGASVADLRRFVGGARLVHLLSTTCFSERAITIALGGLLFQPPPGRRDDIAQSFVIRF